MAGSSGVYPYFDAPVAGMPEAARKAAEAAEEADQTVNGAPAPRYSSLLITGIPRGKKRAVLVLDESEADLSDRLAQLRSLNHGDSGHGAATSEAEPAAAAAAQPDMAAAVAAGKSPLLAKKVPGKAWDFRDMLGSSEPRLLPDTPPPRLADLPEPDLPKPARPEPDLATRAGERLAEPGFALLEPDLQQRLQSLLAPKLLPIAETSVPDAWPVHEWPDGPDLAEGGGMEAQGELWPAAAEAEVIEPPAGGRINAWLRGKVAALLARLRP